VDDRRDERGSVDGRRCDDAGGREDPTLGGIAAGLLVGGVVLLGTGIVLIVAGFRRARMGKYAHMRET
jgi:hypothetical protein